MDNKLKEYLPRNWIPNGGIIKHSCYDAYLYDRNKFCVTIAGRRAGKSWLTLRKLIIYVLNNPNHVVYIGAPVFSQVKVIWWKRVLEALPKFIIEKVIISDLTILLKNGVEIRMVSMEHYSRIEGAPIINLFIGDEMADAKPEAWESAILPALSTRGADARAWLISTPNGWGNWFSQLYLKYNDGHDSLVSTYHWTSAEVLSEYEIESAKNRMSKDLFLQEFCAELISSSDLIYPDYSPENYSDKEVDPNLPIHFTGDQNFTPLSSAIIQEYGHGVETESHLVDEIILRGASAKNLALEFIDKFKNHKNKIVYIHGDPSGNARSANTGTQSHYMIIEEHLRQAGWVVDLQVRRSHLAIRDSQNALRARILSANGKRRFFVNIKKAPNAHEGFMGLQFKAGSAYQEDETNDTQHQLSAVRYYCDYRWPVHEDTFTSSNFMIR